MTINEYKEEVKLVRPQMLAIARNYLKDNDEAEDAVQDVLLKLWQLIDTLHLPITYNAANYHATAAHGGNGD